MGLFKMKVRSDLSSKQQQQQNRQTVRDLIPPAPESSSRFATLRRLRSKKRIPQPKYVKKEEEEEVEEDIINNKQVEDEGEEEEEWDCKSAKSTDTKSQICEQGGMNIWTACQVGDINYVKSIIKSFPEVIHLELQGRTPLYHACKEGHFNIAKVLLEAGAVDTRREAYNVALTSKIRKLLKQYELVEQELNKAKEYSFEQDKDYVLQGNKNKKKEESTKEESETEEDDEVELPGFFARSTEVQETDERSVSGSRSGDNESSHDDQESVASSFDSGAEESGDLPPCTPRRKPSLFKRFLRNKKKSRSFDAIETMKNTTDYEDPNKSDVQVAEKDNEEKNISIEDSHEAFANKEENDGNVSFYDDFEMPCCVRKNPEEDSVDDNNNHSGLVEESYNNDESANFSKGEEEDDKSEEGKDTGDLPPCTPRRNKSLSFLSRSWASFRKKKSRSTDANESMNSSNHSEVPRSDNEGYEGLSEFRDVDHGDKLHDPPLIQREALEQSMVKEVHELSDNGQEYDSSTDQETENESVASSASSHSTESCNHKEDVEVELEDFCTVRDQVVVEEEEPEEEEVWRPVKIYVKEGPSPNTSLDYKDIADAVLESDAAVMLQNLCPMPVENEENISDKEDDEHQLDLPHEISYNEEDYQQEEGAVTSDEDSDDDKADSDDHNEEYEVNEENYKENNRDMNERGKDDSTVDTTSSSETSGTNIDLYAAKELGHTTTDLFLHPAESFGLITEEVSSWFNCEKDVRS